MATKQIMNAISRMFEAISERLKSMEEEIRVMRPLFPWHDETRNSMSKQLEQLRNELKSLNTGASHGSWAEIASPESDISTEFSSVLVIGVTF